MSDDRLTWEELPPYENMYETYGLLRREDLIAVLLLPPIHHAIKATEVGVPSWNRCSLVFPHRMHAGVQGWGLYSPAVASDGIAWLIPQPEGEWERIAGITPPALDFPPLSIPSFPPIPPASEA